MSRRQGFDRPEFISAGGQQAASVEVTSPEAQVHALVAQLAEEDVVARQRARLALEEFGQAAVAMLLEALRSPLDRVRWEAAKALTTIADPRSAPALVERLEDRLLGVRWLAAEGLIAIGRPALRPLLEALVRKPKSIELHEGAHHVLHDLVPRRSFRIIAPILEAMEHPAPELEVPLAAQAVLDRMDAGGI